MTYYVNIAVDDQLGTNMKSPCHGCDFSIMGMVTVENPKSALPAAA